MKSFSPGLGLKKSQRLSESSDVKKVRNQGEKYLIRPFQIYRCANIDKGPRFAIAITTKAGNSVLRNLSKRKIREYFRKHQSKLGNFDFLFYTSKDLSTLDKKGWEEIFKSFNQKFE